MTKITVIVPCYNEQATISLLLNALYHQSYPRSELEVVIADGMSTDRTRELINVFQINHPDMSIQVIDNQARIIPAGLNRAIEAARGEFIIRLDAHSIPDCDYIHHCINALESGKGDNVGGKWDIQPGDNSWLAESIAVAASHPLGVGDALYRLGGKAGAVDTVPFGAFKRELIQRIGFFNESLHTNEDYEFNVRIRQIGGIVWFDPAIRSTYFARSNLRSLAQQYWRYGYWKAHMLRKNPTSIRWRQLLPPILVFTLIVLAAGSIFSPYLRLLFVIVLGLYLLALLFVGLQMSMKKGRIYHILGLPLAIATMHIAWGSAFIWGYLNWVRADENSR